MGNVPKSVPSSVAFSTGNDNVPVLTEAQLGPYTPMTGKPVIPVVPRSDEQTEKTLRPQPGYGGGITTGTPRGSGIPGAPSVPVDGFLFHGVPLDPHYMTEYEDRNPYSKVNNPPTRGMFTWVKTYMNHIFSGKQNVDNAGWQVQVPQQRTSYMRITPPPHAIGYAPETFQPHPLVQQENTYKFNPVTGTDPYGTGVLNSDTFGAGQTAGGIGGNQYTPQPGPPVTSSTADSQSNPSGMPVWG